MASTHVSTHVRRGLVAGLVAGLAFGLFLALVGNPLTAYAEELGHGTHVEEAGHDEAAAHDEAGHEETAVSEAVTELASLGGAVLWGLLLGGAFGLAYFFLEPAVPGVGAAKSLVLAGAGFVVASGAPWLALPPQPAGVEQGLPVETRLAWYGVMVVAGAVACVLAGATYDRLMAAGRRRAVAGVVALVPLALLPVLAVFAPANPVASELPAEIAAAYGGVVITGQLGLWLVLGAAHGWLVGRDAGSEYGATDYGLDGQPSAAD